MWIAFGIIAAYWLYELMKAAKERMDNSENNLVLEAGIRRSGGLISIALIAASFAVLAANANDSHTVGDTTVLVTDEYTLASGLDNLTKIGISSVTGNTFTENVLDHDCLKNTMSRSFLDFGVSGTRTSSMIFMIGFVIAAISSTCLLGENVSNNTKHKNLVKVVSLVVTLGIAGVGLAVIILGFDRLPERPKTLAVSMYDGHNIYDTRELLFGLLGLFLILLALHDLVSIFARWAHRSVITTLVIIVSLICAIISTAGVGLMMSTPGKESHAEHLLENLIPKATAGEKQFIHEMVKNIPPSVTVCLEDEFEAYQNASVLLSFVVPTAMFYAWRAVYASGIVKASDSWY